MSALPKPLTASMSNDQAWRLGCVALDAGDPLRRDIGDPIDRGLILLQLLREKGFEIIERERVPEPLETAAERAALLAAYRDLLDAPGGSQSKADAFERIRSLVARGGP